MEESSLISLWVICLLCATHIHCSEYSSRLINKRVKLVAEMLQSNNSISSKVVLEESFRLSVNNEESARSQFKNTEQSLEVGSVDNVEPSATGKCLAEKLFNKYRTLENIIDLNGLKKLFKNSSSTCFISEENLYNEDSKEVETPENEEETGIEAERGRKKNCSSAVELMLELQKYPNSSKVQSSVTQKNLLPSFEK